MTANITCPCGSQQAYSTCCELFISGKSLPSTPEQLMRSRYTAYTQSNIDYIKQTMASPAVDGFDVDNAKAWTESVGWHDLKVVSSSHSGDKGHVEFIARFIEHGQIQAVHELSEFHRIDGRWFYVDGKRPQVTTVTVEKTAGRNDACPCGSGKKYKKCCMK